MKLVPLSDRVIVKMTEVEETTASGIILASSAKEKPTVAEVIAVGPGGMVDGHEVKMTVSVGQKVIFAKYTVPKSSWAKKNIPSFVRAIFLQLWNN